MAQIKIDDQVVTKDGVGIVQRVMPNGYVIKTKLGARYSAFKFYETKEVKRA